MRFLLRISSVTVLATTACGGPTAPSVRQIPPDHPIDRVDIVAANPAPDSTIAGGSQVTFRVTAVYLFLPLFIEPQQRSTHMAIVHYDVR